MLDSASCQAKFYDSDFNVYPNVTQYQYNGSVQGLYWNVSNPPPFLTYEGCTVLCGTDGPSYYSWRDISTTISTWILPIVTLILQAPFESNAFWGTIFAVFHWIGSPVSSIAAVLWNIKVCGDCALIVDLSTEVDIDFINCSLTTSPERWSLMEIFCDVRDSFYLLTTMNQFTIHETNQEIEIDKCRDSPKTQTNGVEKRSVAERLIRVVLFSDMLKLLEGPTLPERRRKLAKICRDFRKRAVVPVLLTLMWFIYSLITSIVQTFSELGGNEEAHSLAIGLQLGWVPIFILVSVVDRNPTQPEAIRKELNELVSVVRKALLDDKIRAAYIKKLSGTESTRTKQDFDWVSSLRLPDEADEDFFTRFAGQGRVRWHYGIAHDVLAGIKKDFLLRWNRRHGRYWLADDLARERLVTGPKKIAGFLNKFHPNSVWQLLTAFMIFSFCVFGAFVLAYKTPTEGLGCRSGGFMIYFILAITILIIELLCWSLTKPGSVYDGFEDNAHQRERAAIEPMELPGRSDSKMEQLRPWILSRWRHFSARDRIEIFILRPMEVINTIWLSNIVMSQTTGAYRTCECNCSIWGLGEADGYMDFQTQISYLEFGISAIWISSTAVGCLPMAVCFSYIVHEWCVQSHLSTVDFDAAMEGLQRTRSFRGWTSPIRDMAYRILDICYRMFLRWSQADKHATGGQIDVQHAREKYPSIRWTARYNPQAASTIIARDDFEDPVDQTKDDSMKLKTPGPEEHFRGYEFPGADTIQSSHRRLSLPRMATLASGYNTSIDPPETYEQMTQDFLGVSSDTTRVPSRTESIPLSPLESESCATVTSNAP